MFSLSLCRYKPGNGELEQITSDEVLRTAIGNLEDGFRLTLWAYEKKEVNIHACVVCVIRGILWQMYVYCIVPGINFLEVIHTCITMWLCIRPFLV